MGRASEWKNAASGSRILGMEDDSEKVGCGKVFGMNSVSCGFLRGALGNLDTRHHPDVGQILTTTDAPHSPLAKVCGREVREVKIL